MRDPAVALLGLEDRVEHRAVLVELDGDLLPPRARARRPGVLAAQPQRVLGHQYVRSCGCQRVTVTGASETAGRPSRARARSTWWRSQLRVVALGKVGAEVRAARLGARLRRGDDARGDVEQVAELDRAGTSWLNSVPRSSIHASAPARGVGGRSRARAPARSRRGTRRRARASRARASLSSTTFGPGARARDRVDRALLVGDTAPATTAGIATSRRARPACAPARLPKISVSSSELPPRRLAPWHETQAVSPAAYRPGDRRAPSTSTLTPPIM